MYVMLNNMEVINAVYQILNLFGIVVQFFYQLHYTNTRYTTQYQIIGILCCVVPTIDTKFKNTKQIIKDL